MESRNYPRNVIAYRIMFVVVMLLFLFIIAFLAELLKNFFILMFLDTSNGIKPKDIMGEVFNIKAIINTYFVAILAGIIYILISYSPINIARIRLKLGIRKIMTNEEKALLDPIHDEVYNNIIRKYPKAKKRELYIYDSASLNAFCIAVGNEIAIHRGFYNSCSKEEVKAVIAHEYSHSYFKDGLFIKMFQSIYVCILVSFVYPYFRARETFYKVFGNPKTTEEWLKTLGAVILLIVAIYIMFRIIKYMFGIITYPIRLIGNKMNFLLGSGLMKAKIEIQDYKTVIRLDQVVFYILTRQHEFRADEFACYVGYKRGAERLLKRLDSMNYKPIKTITGRILATHPITPERIANIQKE